ncbi:MAG TPA: polysaccharide deacetylase family protein [Abditibacteriaceae bacterium]
MSLLLVECPSAYLEERRYVLNVVLSEFLGLSYEIRTVSSAQTTLRLMEEPAGKALYLPDVLLQSSTEQWLKVDSCPVQPLMRWDIVPELDVAHRDAAVPILFPQVTSGPLQFYSEDEKGIQLGFDVLGGIFFFLTRYEEVAKSQSLDKHQRFSADQSLAVQENFLHRPLVNEYVEILRAALKRLWPRLKFQARASRVLISHDIDRPLSVRGLTLPRLAKNITADLTQRRDVDLAARRIRSFWRLKSGREPESIACDPYNTFSFLMDCSERHGIKSAFYFLAGNSAGDIDANYTLDEPWLKDCWRDIHGRGHEIGLHPSYNTFRSLEIMQKEWATMRRAAENVGITQDIWGGRQHYLRWSNPETWQNWEDVGLDYDSTLTFAEQAGFRCGTCYEYPVFNLHTRRALKLRERPLVVMDGTLLHYCRFSHNQALETIDSLSATCRRFQGDFSLLWHNNLVSSRPQKKFYSEIIQIIAPR